MGTAVRAWDASIRTKADSSLRFPRSRSAQKDKSSARGPRLEMTGCVESICAGLSSKESVIYCVWTNPAATALNELSHAPIVRFSVLALSSIFFLVDPFAAIPSFIAITESATRRGENAWRAKRR